MKDLYKAPEISVEELNGADVICVSPLRDEGANVTERGMDLLGSIAQDFFG